MWIRRLVSRRGKVASRIFLTVVICTLVPMAALVLLTLYTVHSRSVEETSQRLRYAGKNVGMALMAELTAMTSELQRLASQQLFEEVQEAPGLEFAQSPAHDRWQALWLVPFPGDAPKGLPNLTAEMTMRLSAGLSHLSLEANGADRDLFIWVPVNDKQGRKGLAVARLDGSYLWDFAQGFLPSNTYLTITDSRQRPLLHTEGQIPVTSRLIQQTAGRRDASYAEIDLAGEPFFVGFWDLYLKAAFNADSWRIFVAEPRRYAFAQIIAFQKNAGLSALLAFWVILLSASLLIRQILRPLQELKSATRAIGQGDFSFDLKVESRDEFQTLADSFKTMTDKVQYQIIQQAQTGETVRKILSIADREDILSAFLEGLKSVVMVDSIHLILFEKAAARTAELWYWNRTAEEGPKRKAIAGLCPEETKALAEQDAPFAQLNRRDYPGLFQELKGVETDSCLCFYLAINDTTAAVLNLVDYGKVLNGEEIVSVRLLADQLGVALSRSIMVTELQDLNLGTLTALARAVDANSRWTHGHSERVTEYALEIAREMGLSEKQCEEIHYSGLLHDLGKIAIPPEILDKPGKLTEEEYRRVQGHPVEAERIIEPISPFKALLPIIRQHHERWDGQGYPDGLQGKNIHLGSRILAVADVFDALYSNRPYRDGWPHEKVTAYIKDGSGTAFDPEVVAAFLHTRRRTGD